MALFTRVYDYDQVPNPTNSIISESSQPPAGSFWSRNKSRVSILICCFAVFLVLITNVGLTVTVVRTYGSTNGIGTLYEGSCSRMKSISLWLHLVINALATVLVFTSNYCMQRLVSPTRQEINDAHKNKEWMDVGIISLRNLSRISWKRVFLWLWLGLSTLPIHLLYNAAILSELDVSDPKTLVVQDSFLHGAPYSGSIYQYEQYDGDEIAYLQAHVDELQMLNNIDCIQAYASTLLTNRSDLVVVSEFQSNSSVALFLHGCPMCGDPLGWICYGLIGNYSRGNGGCTPSKIEASLGNASNWVVNNYRVKYCLSLQEEERCKIRFSIYIMIAVIICNVVKGVCMLLYTLEHPRTLLTVGDAIDSFLSEEDTTTQNMCVASKDWITTSTPLLEWSSTVSRKWTPKRRFWFAAVSVKQWLLFYILYCIAIGLGIFYLVAGISNIGDMGMPTDVVSLWKMGFGTISSTSLTETQVDGLLPNALLANIPQIGLAVLLLVYNGILTRQFVEAEWNSYGYRPGSKPQPLRVSSRRGKQLSSYRLGLPYIYGLSFMLFSLILHWLLSQSIFLAQIQFYSYNGTESITEVSTYDQFSGTEEAGDAISTCGYSAIALIFTLILGGIGFLFSILNGFRRYDPAMPFAAGCSAIISAACHPSKDEDSKKLALGPLQWGVVSDGAGLMRGEDDGSYVGHCAFSAAVVDSPQEGHLYAGS